MNKTQTKLNRPKLKTGDMVRILHGKDRNKTGKIMAVVTKDMRVLIEGMNMVHRHVRPRRAGEKGQRVRVAAPINISNVQLVCPSCKKSSRIGIRRDNEKRERFCKKCNQVID